MTDTDKLNDAILESGIKIVAIAGKLGISRKGFYKKLNNETEFKDSEIAAMQKILGLTNLFLMHPMRSTSFSPTP